jgi:uncharacterized tellurite resistance protein B-like protein
LIEAAVLRALSSFFDHVSGAAGGDDAESRERELRLATAVLLVEVARADFTEDELELDAVADLLEGHLDMARQEVEQLVAEARQHADHSASLQSFTRQLHEELAVSEKLKIIEMLWDVALSDAVLDKHEDHLIRKVAGLLYISHSDLIRVRNRVQEARKD